MTTPDERTRTVIRTRRFLQALATGQRPAPAEVRAEAETLLRHFPADMDLSLSASALPSVWEWQERDSA